MVPCEVPRGRNSAGTDRTIGRYEVHPRSSGCQADGGPAQTGGGVRAQGMGNSINPPRRTSKARTTTAEKRSTSTEYLVARCKYSHFVPCPGERQYPLVHTMDHNVQARPERQTPPGAPITRCSPGLEPPPAWVSATRPRRYPWLACGVPPSAMGSHHWRPSTQPSNHPMIQPLQRRRVWSRDWDTLRVRRDSRGGRSAGPGCLESLPPSPARRPSPPADVVVWPSWMGSEFRRALRPQSSVVHAGQARLLQSILANACFSGRRRPG